MSKASSALSSIALLRNVEVGRAVPKVSQSFVPVVCPEAPKDRKLWLDSAVDQDHGPPTSFVELQNAIGMSFASCNAITLGSATRESDFCKTAPAITEQTLPELYLTIV